MSMPCVWLRLRQSSWVLKVNRASLPRMSWQSIVISQTNVSFRGFSSSCHNFWPIIHNSKCLRPLISSFSRGILTSKFSRLPGRVTRNNGFRTRPKSVPKEKKTVDIQKINKSENSTLLKPFLFTVSVCGCSFLIGMIWNYENMRKAFKNMRNFQGINNTEEKRFGIRKTINKYWNQFDVKEKIIAGIVVTNIAVFGLWRIPRIQSIMFRYFSSSIKHPLPSMLLSSFSHIHAFHIFANMYVLWNFASHVAQMYGPEQFCAVYLSAGVMSSFVSMALQKILKKPQAVSLGASGAIMGLLGIVCVTHPNAQLSIAFISEIFPHSFSADSGMKAIIAFDLLGLILGWRVMDHAGHLGGMIFGILYAKYGASMVWGNRESIMKTWHNIRGKP